MKGIEIFERFSKVGFISCKCQPRQGHKILIDAMVKLGYKAKLQKIGDIKVQYKHLIFHIFAVNSYRWFLSGIIYVNGKRKIISTLNPEKEYEI